MKQQKNIKYGHPRFYDILDELAELHSKKNFQYASQGDPLGNFYRCASMTSKILKDGINKPLATALMYMSKQIDGVFEIVGEGKEGTADSLKDKLMDISVYSVICMILNEEYGTLKNNKK